MDPEDAAAIHSQGQEGPREMTQGLKVLAAKPEDWSLNSLLLVVL